MARLTEQDEQGNWCAKGLPWKDTYVGQIITKNTQEKIYGALCKLKDYEESGLDPEEAYRLKERDAAKKPEKLKNGDLACSCGLIIQRKNRRTCLYYCHNCGQAIDWSE